MKDLDSDGLNFHYMVCEHTSDLYDFLCTPFCVSNTGYIQSVRINYCFHGNTGMLHMSAIEGVNNSAQNVDKVKQVTLQNHFVHSHFRYQAPVFPDAIR